MRTDVHAAGDLGVGQAGAARGGTGGELRGTATFRWLAGGFFLVQRWSGAFDLDGGLGTAAWNADGTPNFGTPVALGTQLPAPPASRAEGPCDEGRRHRIRWAG